MRVIRTIAELRQTLKNLRQDGKKTALVPTMGALHAGHMSLITSAQNIIDTVIVSIFVNPKQFGPNEDLDAYPRPEQEDLAALSQHNVDIAYLPTAEEMYGAGFNTTISVAGVSEGLCGSKRAGHFDGVALVVTKLLLQTLPDIALFGEKDYQQLQVIKRLVADLNIPVEIMSAPIFRERDGLAMSSRNRYLSENEREIAPLLYQQLRHIATMLSSDNMLSATALIEEAEQYLCKSGFSQIDYIELRDAQNLESLKTLTRPARLLAAAHLGKCRLIDNIAVTACVQ